MSALAAGGMVRLSARLSARGASARRAAMARAGQGPRDGRSAVMSVIASSRSGPGCRLDGDAGGGCQASSPPCRGAAEPGLNAAGAGPRSGVRLLDASAAAGRRQDLALAGVVG